jgi:transposase
LFGILYGLIKRDKTMSFKEYNQDQLFLLPPSLHEFLPKGHSTDVVNDMVNEVDLRELYNRYADLASTQAHGSFPSF